LKLRIPGGLVPPGAALEGDFPVLEVEEDPDPVVLELEEPLGVVEWRVDQRGQHG